MFKMLFGGSKKKKVKDCKNGKLRIGKDGRCVYPKVKKPCKRTGHFRQTKNGPCVKSKKLNNNRVNSMNKQLSSKHMNNRKGKNPCPPGSELVKVGSKKASCRKKCPVGKSRNTKGKCVNDKSNSNIYAEMANWSETKETSLGGKAEEWLKELRDGKVGNNNNINNNNVNNNNNRVLSFDEMNEIADKLNVYNHSKTVNHRKRKTPCKPGKELITVNKKSSCRSMCKPGFVRKSNGQCVNPNKKAATPKQLANLSKGRKIRKDKKSSKNNAWYKTHSDRGKKITNNNKYSDMSNWVNNLNKQNNSDEQNSYGLNQMNANFDKYNTSTNNSNGASFGNGVKKEMLKLKRKNEYNKYNKRYKNSPIKKLENSTYEQRKSLRRRIKDL